MFQINRFKIIRHIAAPVTNNRASTVVIWIIFFVWFIITRNLFKFKDLIDIMYL